MRRAVLLPIQISEESMFTRDKCVDGILYSE